MGGEREAVGYASVFRADLFRGKAAIVTGGGSGIGRAIAHELAALGAQVVVSGRREEKLAAVVAEIEAVGGEAAFVAGDIRKDETIESLVDGCLARFGRIDALVNNAGGQFLQPAATISRKGWTAVLETNLTALFLLSQAVYQRWMQAHGGSIVSVVADMWRGMPMMAHSGAARAGVVNLTRTLALEWAMSGVRVNAVAPGIVRSSGLAKYPEPVQEMLKEVGREIPAGRLATESEVSAACVFLLGPGAAYVTGETIRVDGASSLYRHPVTFPPHEPFSRFDGFHLAADAPEGLDDA